MPTKVIKIESGVPSSGYLYLSDHGHTRAANHDTIIWQIKNNSNVYSITRIEEKLNSTNIFESDPYPEGNHWRGDISGSAHSGDVCEYSIFWKDSEDGPEYEYDPKISIRPSFSPLVQIIALVFALFGISYFIQLILQKEKKRQVGPFQKF